MSSHPQHPAPVDKSDCPYYRGTGICGYGCQTEPSCITDEPPGGWPGAHADFEKWHRDRAAVAGGGEANT